jgi:4'-phosphopantetheinyl transferase
MEKLTAVIMQKRTPLTDERFRELLAESPEELRLRAERMRRPGAENTLLADRLARTMLGSRTGLPPGELVFERNPHGKPFLPQFPELHFNVSHSGAYIACAVAPMPVGIDVQVIAYPKNDVVKRFFTQREQRYVFEAIERDLHFCRIWTRKESYLKRVGVGVCAPLDSFDVLRQPEGLFREVALEGALCQICCDPSVAQVVEIAEM